MKTSIRLYVAGKVSANSVFRSSSWRDAFCDQLEQLTGRSIIHFDPTKSHPEHPLNENDAEVVFGRDCYMIQAADAVIVFLSDDISVGGSQEMLIAKYFKKPLIGIAAPGGKFSGEKQIFGRTYSGWTHPFVKTTCDVVVPDVAGAASALCRIIDRPSKDLSLIPAAMRSYRKSYFSYDHLPVLPEKATAEFIAYKGLIVDAAHERILAMRYFDRGDIGGKVRGRLGMTGGKIRQPETAKQDFQKRAKEETGVDADISMPLGTWSWNYERGNALHHIFAIGHVARYRGGDIQEPYRHNEFDLRRAEWISFEGVRVGDFIEDEQPLVRTFLQAIKQNPFVSFAP